MNIDKWAKQFNEKLEKAVDQPFKEIFTEGVGFCNWRISYGIQTNKPAVIYFLSFYPAFCLNPKATYHYNNLSDLAMDVLEIENFLNDIYDVLKDEKKVKTDDIIAATFAILRDKESIELFQEQKDLMELGLKHYHLDNLYQERIHYLCKEYSEKKQILGKNFDLKFFDRIKNGK